MQNAKKHIAILFVLIISTSQIVHSFHAFSHIHVHEHENEEVISNLTANLSQSHSLEASFDELCECLLCQLNNSNPTFTRINFVAIEHKSISYEEKAKIAALETHTQKQIIAQANSLRAPPII